MNFRYLPIGSVVSLRGSAKRVMVVGYYGVDNTGLQCDYMGFSYPEGLINPDKVIGFDQVDIQEIIFEGYKDVEQEQLFVQLDAYAKGVGQTDAATGATIAYQQTVPVGQSIGSNNDQNQ